MKRFFKVFIQSPSASVWLIISVIIYWSIVNVGNYRNWHSPIQYDVKFYYAYLPAVFIENDILLNYADADSNVRKWLVDPIKLPNGNNVLKMTCGVAYYYAPFFFIAHVYSLVFDNPNGYSHPYRLLLIIGGAFYCCAGLLLLRKILLRKFSELVTATTLAAIGLGSNLFYYSFHEGMMSHVYLFFTFILVMWFTIKWHESSRLIYAAALGFFCGLCLLIRPNCVLIALIPILYNIYSSDSLNKKVLFIRKHFTHVVIAAIVFFIPIIPQLLYWKTVSGNWIFYSYLDEGFNFKNPQLLNGLFSFRKGWLIYTPVMVFAVAGMFTGFHRLKEWFIPILLFMLLNIYIIFSWWCWWYGGGFGMRALIESYALLALPMAVVFEKLFRFNFLKLFTLLMVTGLISLNLFQTYQYRYFVIHWDAMTKEAYSYVFLKKSFSEEERKKLDSLLVHPDYSDRD